MITWHELLNEGKERLYNAGNSEQAAMLLLNELCQHADINLYTDLDLPADTDIATDYLEAVHRMENGEPLSYVLGYENFYGYDFTVTPDVLIPRPETEELVGLVLQIADACFPDKESIDVLDVATGSGAIGITLSLEEPRMQVTASDISKDALRVASANNDKLHGRVRLLCGDMLEPFIQENLQCDILVCNPPYIPDQENMERSVIDYEPHVALFGGSDGLKFYRRIFSRADQLVRPGGFMAFEMGYDQGERLSRLAQVYFPDAEIKVHQDMSGKDRMLSIRLPE